MLYTCCNSSRNTWQRGCGCGCGNTTNTTNTTNGNGCGCGCGNVTNTANNGWGTNTFVNGVYGIFFPITNRTCLVRRTTTLDCGNAGTWTNGNGCGCGCRRNLCATNSSATVINGDAYYARQYGLNGCGCSHTGWNCFTTDN